MIATPLPLSKSNRGIRSAGEPFMRIRHPKEPSEMGDRGLSVSIVGNQIIAITGPRQVGKSKYLRVLAGLEAPSSGETLTKKCSMVYLGARRKAGGLQTPYEAVTAYYDTYNVPYDPTQVATELQAWGFEAHLAGGGTASRALAVLRTLMIPKKNVYLLDDPTDEMTTDQIKLLIKKMTSLKKEGATIVLATGCKAILHLADKLILFSENELKVAFDHLEVGLIRSKRIVPTHSGRLIFSDSTTRTYIYLYTDAKKYMRDSQDFHSNPHAKMVWTSRRDGKQALLELISTMGDTPRPRR